MSYRHSGCNCVCCSINYRYIVAILVCNICKWFLLQLSSI
ncbi:hypothetical protein MmTuc01_3001 [Methanosarcina mazei Tuc01]|uniref:Uncharacterized protein n=1 Tax=Methanosarcina mazei Tuc01 TaxID=1236903 RepID=M1Q7F1_METMZ|nr:hypothetical protein MmTuc01_3001 [Methanosarcina mazei Tuc01]